MIQRPGGSPSFILPALRGSLSSGAGRVQDVSLCYLYLTLAVFRLLLCHLRQRDDEDTVVNLGRDFLSLDVVRQHIHLLVVAVAELAAQVVLVLVFLLVLELVLYRNLEIALAVEIDAAVLFLYARNGELHGVVFHALFHVHCRCGGFHLRHPVVVKEIVEY